MSLGSFGKRAATFAATLALVGWVCVSEWKSVRAYTLIGGSYSGTSCSYMVNPNFVDAAAGTPAQQLTAIQAAASSWQTQTGIDFAFSYGGQTSIATVAFDGTNTVFYSDADGAGALAVCYYWMGGGSMFQFDIEFYDRDGAYNFVWALTPSLSQFDIQGVATHEFGHALGLGHTTVVGATMYPSVAAGDTSGRSLHADDISGAVALYGLAPPLVTGCSPSSVFVDGSGGTVTITGQNFSSSGLVISVGGQVAANPAYVSPTEVTCTIPPAPALGSVPVEVCCGGLCGSNAVFSYDTMRTFVTPSVGDMGVFELYAPTLPGKIYQTYVSLGNAGIPLNQFCDPQDPRVLPVSFDALLAFHLTYQNSGWFWNFHGQLDGQGAGMAGVGVPPDPTLAGTTIYLSWVVYDPSALSGVTHVGNGVTTTILP